MSASRTLFIGALLDGAHPVQQTMRTPGSSGPMMSFLLFGSMDAVAADAWKACEPSSCDAGVAEGCGCLKLLTAEECPANIYSTAVFWNCRGAPLGSLCEGGDDDCGTNDNANNCMVIHATHRPSHQ